MREVPTNERGGQPGMAATMPAPRDVGAAAPGNGLLRAVDVLLAVACVAPLVAGAVAVWTVRAGTAYLALNATLFYGATFVAFQGGVRRGVAQGLATTVGLGASLLAGLLLVAGFGSAFAVAWGFPFAAACLSGGSALVLALLDPFAAWRRAAPRHFMALRPLEMLTAAAALGAVAVYARYGPIL